MLAASYTETLTLTTRTASGEDSDGNDAYTSSSTTSDGWTVYPRNSSELVQGQDTTIVGITATIQTLVAVKVTDRVTVVTGPYAGTYEVDGLPGFYSNPVTAEQATELHLTKVTG